MPGAAVKLLCVHPGAGSSTSDVYRGYTRALERQGHEIIPYLLDRRLASFDRWLRWQWRRGGRQGEAPTMEDVFYRASADILERALWHLPDWVIVFSGSNIHPRVFTMLRRLGCPTMLLLTESPYLPDLERAMAWFATVCFTNERTCVDEFREICPHTYYLPHAYAPAIHHPDISVADDVPAHDVVFVGTGFEERIELLAGVDWSGINLGLYGIWKLLGSRHPLRQYLRGGVVANERTAQLYKRATIGLNLFRSSMGFGRGVDHVHTPQSMNPRSYELAACDVFQLSEYRPEVDEQFCGAVPTFRDAEDLSRHIRYWLASPLLRERYAHLARLMVQDETFDERARFIVGKLDAVAQEKRLRIVSRDGANPVAVMNSA